MVEREPEVGSEQGSESDKDEEPEKENGIEQELLPMKAKDTH